MNKKAQEKTVLNTIIDLILVTLALLALFGIYKGLISVMGGENKATVNNFNELVNQINGINDVKIEMPIFIDEDHFIIAIGKNNDLIGGYSYEGLNNKPKPVKCTDSSCLCLCSKKEGCDNAICNTNLNKEYEFDDENSYAIIPGNDKPQTVYIRKLDKSVELQMDVFS